MTLHLPFGAVVAVSDPAAIRDLFTADPALLRAGAANAALEPVVGPESILLLDGDRHMRRRRLVLPPFHGERLAGYAGDIARRTAQDLERWPVGRPFALEARMRAITLDVILTVVFGLRSGVRADRLRALIPQVLPDGGVSSLALLPALRRDLGPWRVWGRFLQARAAVDRELYGEIARRRADPALGERTDVLSLLLAARDEDGTPMSDRELRDELMTLLLAGHETTATALAWALLLLLRRPDALARATAEVRAGGPAPYLEAAITETLRLKPPLPMAVRLSAAPVRLAGHDLPAGTRIAACIYLAHRRPELYPDPLAFRPERFLAGRAAGPPISAFLPFGGGTRRCAGAAFAQLELRTVLRTVLEHVDLAPAGGPPERTRRRAVVLAPSAGARAIVAARA